MTPLDKLLARLRELEEDATKIPWRQQTGAIIKGNGDLVFDSMPGHAYPALDTDVQLIAESRNALPVLLEIISRQKEVLEYYSLLNYPVLNGRDLSGVAKIAIAECDALALEEIGIK
jgi:hypothetical protein